MGALASTTITLEEFARLPGDGLKHEVSFGELTTLPPAKSLHALIALSMLEMLQENLRGKSFKALPEAGFLLCSNPLTIRQPDVSVLCKQRIANANEEAYFEGSPELAIEVVSPSDSADDIETKVRQYLKYGAHLVWVLYPKTKDVHVFRADSSASILEESQMLDGGDLLPDFAVLVAHLFVI